MNRIQIETLADELLDIIRKRPGTAYTVDGLTKRLKAERAEAEAAIETLKKLGYKLRTRAGSVTFVRAADSLTGTEIGYKLRTKFVGQTVHAYRTVKSTNDIAADLAAQGAPEGTIVVAEEQTKGRGRFSRSWFSPAGSGIYLSIVLKPAFVPEKAPAISIMTSVALAETLEKFCPGKVQIKWPNDILLAGKKAVGVLTELSAERGHINHIIVGIGINVNNKAEDFPAEIKHLATSVRHVRRRKVSRVELLQLLLLNFEREYLAYQKHRLKKSHHKIRKYSALIGHEVTLVSGDHVHNGKVVDIDIDGCLVLEENGVKMPIMAGEVTVVKD